MSAPRIRLVTRADDAGSSRSANRAIREACVAGLARNVSLMAPCPHIADAAAVLRDLPGVCFGMHVTLNCEWEVPRWGPLSPASAVPSLVEADGSFTRFPVHLHERNAAVDEMMVEVAAQLAHLRALGFRLSYLDQHMGVGWVCGLGERLSAFAAREGLIDADRVVRGLPEAPTPASPGADQHVDDLIARLAASPPGTFMALGHPCYDDAEMALVHGAGASAGEVGRDRDGQRRMFLDPRVRAAFAKHDVAAITYAEAVGAA